MKTALIAATLLLGFAVIGTPQSAQAAPLTIASVAGSQVDAGSSDLLHTVRDRRVRNNRASDGFRRQDFGNRHFTQRGHFSQRRSFGNRGFRGSRFGNRGFVNRGFGHHKFGNFRGGRSFSNHNRFGFSGFFFGRH